MNFKYHKIFIKLIFSKGGYLSVLVYGVLLPLPLVSRKARTLFYLYLFLRLTDDILDDDNQKLLRKLKLNENSVLLFIQQPKILLHGLEAEPRNLLEKIFYKTYPYIKKYNYENELLSLWETMFEDYQASKSKGKYKTQEELYSLAKKQELATVKILHKILLPKNNSFNDSDWKGIFVRAGWLRDIEEDIEKGMPHIPSEYLDRPKEWGQLESSKIRTHRADYMKNLKRTFGSSLVYPILRKIGMHYTEVRKQILISSPPTPWLRKGTAPDDQC